jgi:hypothetical protein
VVEVDPRSPRSDDCLVPGSLSPRSPMMTLERGCLPSSVPPSPPSELSCFSTPSSSPRRSDVSLLRTPRLVQADSKVSTKEAMSPSPLKSRLNNSSSLRPPFSHFRPSLFKQNIPKLQSKSLFSKFQTHHITSFSFSQATFGRCNTQIDYRRWVVYMIYGKCRDVTSANMIFAFAWIC